MQGSKEWLFSYIYKVGSYTPIQKEDTKIRTESFDFFEAYTLFTEMHPADSEVVYVMATVSDPRTGDIQSIQYCPKTGIMDVSPLINIRSKGFSNDKCNQVC